MAEDINSITIIGRLTRDAELKYTNTGQALTKFSLAVNRSKKVGDQWIEEASFFDVTLWGRRGESLNQYLIRGTRIAVTGELVQDRWEQDGQSRSMVFINANNVQLLGNNQQNIVSNRNNDSRPAIEVNSGGNNTPPAGNNNPGGFEDIPF